LKKEVTLPIQGFDARTIRKLGTLGVLSTFLVSRMRKNFEEGSNLTNSRIRSKDHKETRHIRRTRSVFTKRHEYCFGLEGLLIGASEGL
jgi:hypothetical protein